MMIMTAGCVCLCDVCSSCGSPWSVCEVVVSPYVVGAVVDVTVMHVLLFVLHVFYAARVTAMLMWGPGRCGCG